MTHTNGKGYNPRTTPVVFFFFFFFAVENKYSDLSLPGNKFSAKAREENK